jgi:hypothetical protein
MPSNSCNRSASAIPLWMYHYKAMISIDLRQTCPSLLVAYASEVSRMDVVFPVSNRISSTQDLPKCEHAQTPVNRNLKRSRNYERNLGKKRRSAKEAQDRATHPERLGQAWHAPPVPGRVSGSDLSRERPTTRSSERWLPRS